MLQIKECSLKKVIIVIIFLCVFIQLYSINMTTSFGVKSNNLQAPVYSEIGLFHSFDIFSLQAIYKIGYDTKNKVAFNEISIGASLAFSWGTVSLTKEYGNNINETELRINF